MVQGNQVSQLGALSPSAGGNPQGGATGPYPGSTVVVVQAPGTVMHQAQPAPEMPKALARPVAVAVAAPQVATAHIPAPPAAAPKALPPAAGGDKDTQQLEQILTK